MEKYFYAKVSSGIQCAVSAYRSLKYLAPPFPLEAIVNKIEPRKYDRKG